MMKRILILLDPSEYTVTALKYAAEIAGNNRAKLEGVAIIDTLSITEAVAAFVPLPESAEKRIEREEKLLNDVRIKTKKMVNSFKEFCQENNLSCNVRIFEGRPEYVAEEESAKFDLLITGLRTKFHFETKREPEKSVSELIKNTSVPIFAVPGKYRPVKEILYAYDGSEHAVKALKTFLDFMPAKNYHFTILIHTHNPEKISRDITQIKSVLTDYQNISTDIVITHHALIHVFDTGYADNVDMVICGKNTRSFLKNFHLGSFPKHLINLNKIPVLIG